MELRVTAAEWTLTACIDWPGSRLDAGYGKLYVPGQGMVLAHRWVWEQVNGEPVPDGLFVCHRCDHPPCINPTHLFLGTPLDNNEDKMAKGRHRTNGNEQRTHCKRGHAFDEENTYVWRGHRHCRACQRTRRLRS